MRLRGWWVLVSGVTPFVAACALIVGIDTRPPRPTAADASLPDPSDPCVHLTAPSPPAQQDDDEQDDFTVAVRSVAYETAGHDVGLDLDGTCTCDLRPGTRFDGGPSCVPAQGATPASQCDADGGIDNTFIKLPYLQSVGVDQSSLNAALDCGSGGLVLGISGYNGRANDTNVDVAFLPTLGILVPHEQGESPAVCTSSPPPVEVTYRPRWDGTDPWSPTFLAGTTTTAIYYLSGYVRDWTLVATVSGGAKIPIPFNSIRPRLFAHQGQLVATITPLDNQRMAMIAPTPQARARYVTLDGTLTGRAPVDQLIERIPIPSNPGPHCPGTPLFDELRTGLCQVADIATEPGDDHSGQPCSALSLGIQFHAETAVQGAPEFEDAGPSVCDAAAPQPCGLPP